MNHELMVNNQLLTKYYVFQLFYARLSATLDPILNYAQLLSGFLKNISKLILHTLQSLLQRSEEHTCELQSRENLVCRLLLEKKKTIVCMSYIINCIKY